MFSNLINFSAQQVQHLSTQFGYIDTTVPFRGQYNRMDLIYIITPGSQYTNINVLMSVQTMGSPPSCSPSYLEFFTGTSADPAKSLGRICTIRSGVDATFPTGRLTARFYAGLFDARMEQQAVFTYRAYVGMYSYLNYLLYVITIVHYHWRLCLKVRVFRQDAARRLLCQMHGCA